MKERERERKGEVKGKERKGKERKGKERKGNRGGMEEENKTHSKRDQICGCQRQGVRNGRTGCRWSKDTNFQ